MENIGYVAEIKDGIAKIKIIRESACGSNCQSCGGCSLKEHFVEADLEKDFLYSPKVGDQVKIKLDNKIFYAYSAAGYAVFSGFLAFGGVLGYMVLKTDTGSLLGALAGLFCGFVLVKLLFKNKKSCLKVEKVV